MYSKLKNLNSNIEIRKSKRKQLTIEINYKGDILVKAPLYATNEEIYEILKKKENWICENIYKMKTNNKNILKRKYINGEIIFLLGKVYTIKISKYSLIDHIKKEICIKEEGNRDEIINLYKDFAYEYIKQRVDYFSNNFEVTAKDIKIKSQKTIWGSCTHNNVLSFNYKIIIAKAEIIDYLIIHEMSHMIYKNHSKDFWNCVEHIIKDAKVLRQELKKITYMLEI